MILRLGIVAVVLSTSTSALAGPSIWRRAAAPQRHAAAQARAAGDEHLDEHYRLSQGRSPLRQAAALSKAKRVLEGGGAPEADDPITRYQMGRVHHYLYELERDARQLEVAAEHLLYVARHPKTPTTLRAQALQTLAISYARLGRHEDEVKIYDDAIAYEPDPDRHAVLQANQAEGHMALGRILQAVRGYRAALRATSSTLMLDSGVTTLWGLAVALDRSGDLEGALSTIARARTYDPLDQRLNGSGWFYVPAYDEAYYGALGMWQRARAEDDPVEREQNYRDAVASWRSFLDRAPLSDPWVRLAERRLAECEAERKAKLTSGAARKRPSAATP